MVLGFGYSSRRGRRRRLAPGGLRRPHHAAVGAAGADPDVEPGEVLDAEELRGTGHVQVTRGRLVGADPLHRGAALVAGRARGREKAALKPAPKGGPAGDAGCGRDGGCSWPRILTDRGRGRRGSDGATLPVQGQAAVGDRVHQVEQGAGDDRLPVLVGAPAGAGHARGEDHAGAGVTALAARPVPDRVPVLLDVGDLEAVRGRGDPADFGSTGSGWLRLHGLDCSAVGARTNSGMCGWRPTIGPRRARTRRGVAQGA
jgi:hypothetical protein